MASRSSRLRIDPNFERPEPTPADFFCTVDVPETPEESQRIIKETFDRWRVEGVSQARVTITGPKAVDDKTGYPPGLWMEGWLDPKADQLPFGAPWPDENSGVWPGLTAQEKS